MWWIIAGIVLVLVVVGLLLYIFSDKITGFRESTESCLFKGGVCKESCDADEQAIENTDCSGEKPVCCVGI